MLDPARGFLPVERVKRVVDQMGRAKLNRLHLHLVDAESSAFAFERYPELSEPTDFGSVPDLRGLNSTDQSGPPNYSPEDVAELVGYADRRNVEIVPEIDVPGHSTLALLAYPELRCEVDGGDPSYWTLCAGAEATYEFLDGVVGELAAHFPSEVVHVGTDEYEYDASWGECAVCRRRMAEEGLDDERELFYYFLRRLRVILADHGRRAMVWNEEIDVADSPDVPDDLLVQFWRVADSEYGPTEAGFGAYLREGFEVVNSFVPAAYVDRHASERALLGWTPTSRPVAPEGYEDRVLGGEMTAWSGWEDEGWKAYYRRALPSAIPVFADRVWNGAPVDDYEGFVSGVTRHVFGPRVPPDLDVYGELGGLVLPVDGDRNEERAHVYESLGDRSVAEALASYESTADRLRELLAADAVRYPDAAEAYVECLEWLAEVVEREGRGVIERP